MIRDSLNVIIETAIADANATWNLTEIDQGLAMMIENPEVALQLIFENTGVEFESLDELFYVMGLIVMCDNATLSEVDVSEVIAQAEARGLVVPGELTYTNATQLCEDLMLSPEF